MVDRRVLEALLDLELPRTPRGNGAAAPRLVIVHGRYRPGAPTEFSVRIGEQNRQVKVSDQASVLGVIDAWEEHNARASRADSDSVLVVTTGVDENELGLDLRGHALGRKALSVDRAEIVKQRFGAADLDPRIRQDGWLVDALLDAEPSDGWRDHPAATSWRRSGGTVLTRDAAVHALVEARLDISGALSGTGPRDTITYRDLDADTFLAWSRTPGAAERFAALPQAEREGLAQWLRQSAGDAVAVLLALIEAGRGRDAMPLGVIAGVMTGPAASPEVALTVGGLLAGISVHPAELRAFNSAVQGTLARWIGEAGSERRGHQAARDRAMAVLERADALVHDAGLDQAFAGDPFLPSGLDARLRDFATVLQEPPQTVDAALSRVMDHQLVGLFADRRDVAEMAARIRRWLEVSAEDRITSVADGVRRHVAEWGWVDRALTVLWGGDPRRDPMLERAYRALYERARARRAELDRQFAEHLATWATTAAAEAPEGTLPVESVLSQVVRPLVGETAPLVLVLDGMSGSVAAQLGEELARTGRWLEATAVPGTRRAAVSMIPSVTRLSRASLLCGKPCAGGQATEANGFAAFWKRHGGDGVLFHKSQIPGRAGQRFADALLDALAGDDVVGVVLNTIDDALDHDREGDRMGWTPSHITFLPDLLNAARDFKRPVVLVADHGHVLERGEPGSPPTPAPGAESARWRTGAPAEGEVELTGLRVLEGGGRIVAAWREDIRYTPRKAGYHGGASLAEMSVPVLVMLPSSDLLPRGWTVLPPEETVPAWWSARTGGAPGATAPAPAQEPAPAPAPAKPRRTTKPEPRQSEALFPVGEVEAEAPATRITPAAAAKPAAAPATLGSRVTGSASYADQKKYLRKAPEARQVAAVIDALAGAGGTLSPAAVGSAASAAGGRPPRSPELFITALQRLLNIEGYTVLGLIDGGRTVKLDEELLREQFGVEDTS
ncbi:BREX-2 system phosphatase PglZ [Spirillospora sp. NPDC047279]|uniref:BREX-2 system phosphatase PglZ n=1 Tax=Spirillospora sp. NPDC047279 TaxID=3155478 RepID=UPI0033C221B0